MRTGLVSSPWRNIHSREWQDYPYILSEVTSWTWRMKLFGCSEGMLGKREKVLRRGWVDVSHSYFLSEKVLELSSFDHGNKDSWKYSAAVHQKFMSETLSTSPGRGLMLTITAPETCAISDSKTGVRTIPEVPITSMMSQLLQASFASGSGKPS